MNFQKKPSKEILQILKNENVDFRIISYYAWPQIFGTTAGPSGGYGGDAMSDFTIEAYVCDNNGPTVYICADMYHFEDQLFKGSGQRYAYDWKKISNIKEDK